VELDALESAYLNSHDNVVIAVSAEEYDAGGVMDSVAEKSEAAGEVRILATSQPIPEFPLCANSSLPADLRGKIVEALMKLNEATDANRAVLTSINPRYTGVEIAEDGDYDVIREMVLRLYGEEFYAK
jgi:ABC-type phosphate/phosphonate transport system substrate-binding protein